MTPSNPDNKHLYEQIADELRKQIDSGNLKPGDPLPSEADLQAKHGVSRQTVRLAFRNLAQEGLISGGQGRPRTVRTWEPLRWRLSAFESIARHAAGDPASDQWAEDVRTQGREPRQDVEVAIVYPPPRVAELLGVDPETPTVARRRIRYVDGAPFALATSYFHEEDVRGTPLMQPKDVSAPGGVLASIGLVQARFIDEVHARMPTRAEADALDMSPGTPVAEHIRTGYDSQGKTLRVMITIAPGDRYILVYELDAS
ncbi:GntR family transcriptional regulator [Microbispora sp. NPDC049125]|uniref:GntR family transcriptional regulator n=1 Tax=Microbispora sp. NPDC049125 TaxID=3154929 RepID=UPI0034679919